MHPHSARFSSFPDIYIWEGYPNFYPNSSCILWTRRIQFWCPLRLRWSLSDDLVGSPARVRKLNQPIIFHNRIFYKLYRKNIPELCVSYYPPTFSCRLGFFATSYLHLHSLHCRACTSWTPRARPQHRPLHTAKTHRRDTCPLFPFPMPALSPPARLCGTYSKELAQMEAEQTSASRL